MSKSSTSLLYSKPIQIRRIFWASRIIFAFTRTLFPAALQIVQVMKRGRPLRPIERLTSLNGDDLEQELMNNTNLRCVYLALKQMRRTGYQPIHYHGKMRRADVKDLEKHREECLRSNVTHGLATLAIRND